MTDPDIIPTLPRPAPLPREEAPTPRPRLSALEELRASPEPPAWLEAVDALEGRLMAAIGAVAARGEAEASRSSQTDFAQQEKINELEAWRKKLTENAAAAAASSESTEAIATSIASTVATMARPLRWNSPQVASLASSFLTLLLAGLVAYLRNHGVLP